jgi:hypothetical protein
VTCGFGTAARTTCSVRRRERVFDRLRVAVEERPLAFHRLGNDGPAVSPVARDDVEVEVEDRLKGDFAITMKATTASSSYTTLASACRATMAQKMHPRAVDVASCVMRAIVPVRRDRCYSVNAQPAQSRALLGRECRGEGWQATERAGGGGRIPCKGWEILI